TEYCGTVRMNIRATIFGGMGNERGPETDLSSRPCWLLKCLSLCHRYVLDRNGSRSGCGFILAPRGPAAAFGCHFRHPGRRPPAALSAAARQALEAQDCLFDLHPFFTQLGENFRYVHASHPPPVRAQFDPRTDKNSRSPRIISLYIALFTPISEDFQGNFQ